MKQQLNLIKILILAGLVIGLYSFTNIKNSKREVTDLNIIFEGDNNLFLTQSNVSKLLIQNQNGLTDKAKRIIDLNLLETALKSNPMIKKAEVYMSIDGVISAEIEQKRPLARVLGDEFYIDDTGSWMPLSKNYTARVPLVTGNIERDKLNSIYSISKYIDADPFLKKQIIEIRQESKNNYVLRLRRNNLLVELGDLNLMEKKFNNLKAFYQKALKDDVLDAYSKINLRFSSQVICTKK